MNDNYFFIFVLIVFSATTILVLGVSYWFEIIKGKNKKNVRYLNNIKFIKDQLTEIENQKISNLITDEDFQKLKEEIELRAIEDIDENLNQDKSVDEFKPIRIIPSLVVISITIIIGSSLLYLFFGNPDAILTRELSNPSSKDTDIASRQEFEEMLKLLEQKLQNDSENLKIWTLLARSYKSIGNLPKAIEVFSTIEELLPAKFENDAQLLAEFADALASHNKSFAGKPNLLIKKALALEPKNLLALWLAGSSNLSQENYAESLKYWTTIRQLLSKNSEDLAIVEKMIKETSQKARLSSNSQSTTSLNK